MPAHKLPGNQAAINKAEYNKRWRAENRERVRERERQRRLANPEQFKAKRERWRAKPENKAKDAAYAREYWQKNGETVKAKLKESGKNSDYSARYRERNHDKCLQMTQAWKDANPERRAATQAAYLQNNLDKHRVNQHRRRARKKASGGHLSSDIVKRLFALQRGRCACCGAPLGDKYDLDHIVPLALGGENSDENVQLLTSRCNRQKGAKPPVEFMQSRGKLL